jgi:hypothetical protein
MSAKIAGNAETSNLLRRITITTVDANVLDTATADKTHRQHAVIEKVNADLKDSALAHLPSGVFTAKFCLAGAVIAYNLTRADPPELIHVPASQDRFHRPENKAPPPRGMALAGKPPWKDSSPASTHRPPRHRNPAHQPNNGPTRITQWNGTGSEADAPHPTTNTAAGPENQSGPAGRWIQA